MRATGLCQRMRNVPFNFALRERRCAFVFWFHFCVTVSCNFRTSLLTCNRVFLNVWKALSVVREYKTEVFHDGIAFSFKLAQTLQ